MLGYGDVAYADVVVDNTCPNDTNKPCYEPNFHAFTEGTGSFIYALYHLFMIIVLLNMLIALMSDTFAHIQVRYIGNII